MGLVNETCSLLRPLPTSTNGGLIIGTSLYLHYIVIDLYLTVKHCHNRDNKCVKIFPLFYLGKRRHVAVWFCGSTNVGDISFR